ncbi:MAG: signal transduction protein [Chloroflexi bacterium]|nr:MAG: signal transduction protein [Chloroflexota bacterium]MBA4376662.1 histidine kinase [Anaerolinea sp.]
MATVETILKTKGKAVYSVTPATTILDALKLMAEKDIGAVMVMEGDKVMGIFSERDYARRGTLQGNPVTTPVKDVMTHKVYYVGPEQSAEACMAQMIDKHFRHLPVVKDGKVVGVISIGDVVKTILSDKETLIKGLENFLVGRDFKQ